MPPSVQELAQLDPARPADRRAALDAMESLVDQFVTPAAALLSTSETDPENLWFDLDRIAGTEVHGLVLGLLAKDFPELEPPPPDELLAARLDDRGLEIATPERRADFFRAWTAQRAASLVRSLLRVVAEPLSDGDLRERAWELDRLRALRDAPLPSFERYALEVAVRE
jgi:hypothetical protein